MGRAPAQNGVQAVQGAVCASGSDLSTPAPQMIRMSTGHMEGNLQLLYVLLTDCYVYLLRKGACHPPPKPSRLPPLYPLALCPRVSLCCMW